MLVLGYVKQMDERFHTSVINTVATGPLKKAFLQTSSDVFDVSAVPHWFGRLGAVRVVKRFLRDINPDIVHTHLLGADIIGYLWKQTHRRVRWVATLHNTEYHTMWIKRLMWRTILRRADVVIAVSPAVASYAQQVFRVPSKKIHLIENAIDVARFQSLPVRSSFHIPVRIATVGRLEAQKGHALALRALALLLHRDWEYHVYGDGTLVPSLHAQTIALGIVDQVVWHGEVSDVVDAYADADIILQPSHWEGMSLAIMEAMASAKCIVASDTSAGNMVVDNETGFVFPSGDVEKLTFVLNTVLGDAKSAHHVAEQARNVAVKRFGFAHHLEAVARVYDDICFDSQST